MMSAVVTTCIAILLLTGSLLALLGAIGLLRLKLFYQRVHSPTLSTSYGAFLIVLGTMLWFFWHGEWGAWQAILISLFLFFTAPISLMLLVRGALYRDRRFGHKYVPMEDRRHGR